MQRKHKTTLILDPEVWRRFQEHVIRSEGPRATSAEVERLLRATDPEIFASALAAVFERPDGGFPSSDEIERKRPRLPGGTGRLIREARDEREDRLFGLERDRKAILRRRGNRGR